MKPGYKQTEVGVIPEEWEVKRLGDLVDTDPENLGSETPPTFAFRYIALEDVDCGVLKSYSERQFASAPSRARRKLRPQDVLVSTVRPNLRSHLLFQTEDGNWVCSTGFCVMRCREGTTNPGYIFPHLFAACVNRQIEALLTGSNYPAINSGDVRALEIPIPPLPEQRAIATALSDVEGLLGGLDRLIAKKRDLKQGAMQQLLTGQTRLPGFHGEWGVKTFEDLFNFSGGYSASRDQLSSEGHCYLHYGDIHGAKKTTVDVRADYQNIPKLDIPLKRIASKSLLEDGDVVFVDASEDDEGASRHVVVVNKDKKPFISGLHTIVAKSKTDEMAHAYRRYCFQTAAIRQQFLFYAVGTKVSGISKTNIAKLKMPVPKVSEQTAIAEVLTEMDAELAVLEQRREKTRALKQAMMQELLTGRTRLV